MPNRIFTTATLFCLIILGLTGCALKKMISQAEQYEAAGMFKEASEMYYSAVLKKPTKAELKIDLRRTGQLYMEELAVEIKNTFNRSEYKESVYYYLESRELISKLSKVGVSIKQDPASERYYEQAKNFYLDGRYSMGLKHITSEDFDEAKTIFQEISNIDPEYKDTQSYLNQATYEPIYREGSLAFSEQQFMLAYNKWARIYSNEKSYKDVKSRMDQALNERYKEGTLLLMNEEFNPAAQALGDVYHVNPNFKDVKTQYFEARNEPIYRHANKLMSQEKCRTAYFDFERILNDAGSYKDSKTLKAQALKCAQYPIAVYSKPIKNHQADALLFENALTKNLLGKNNIFLKVYDLSSINSRVEGKLIKGVGGIDEASLQTLKNNNGIEAVLVVEYGNYNKSEGKLQKQKLTGFERIVTKNKDGETNIYDKKTNYYEYQKENEISLSATYKLVSTTTGEILLSDTHSGNLSDEVNYASFSGDKSQLYPAKSNSGTWSVNESGYKSLQRLFRSESAIKSIGKLQKQLFDNLSDDIAADINSFNPEK